MKSIVKLLFFAILGAITAPLFNISPAIAAPALVLLSFIPKHEHAAGLNNMDMRLVFENAKAALAKAFNYPPASDMLAYFKLTQNSVRLEQPIVAGQTLYNFPVLNNQGTAFNTEQRMKLQDTNVIYQVGVFLGTPTSATDQAWTPLSYPNEISFGANARAQYALYNGLLNITINNDQVVTQWDIYRHLYKGETQQTAALGAGSPGDQNRASWDGYYPMEPNVTLIGQKDNNIQILLPTGGISAATEFSRIMVHFRTILAQNSTVVS